MTLVSRVSAWRLRLRLLCLASGRARRWPLLGEGCPVPVGPDRGWGWAGPLYGPTQGCLLGVVLAAYVAGWLARRSD